MKLKASCEIAMKTAIDCPVVAMLRPRSGLAQWMVSESYDMRPQVATTEYVDSYGNLCQRFVVPKGAMSVAVEVTMTVDDQVAVDPEAQATPIELLPADTLLYLLQSRYCPSDKVEEKAKSIVGDARTGYAQAEKIRVWIYENLKYQYGVSSATTDALETLRDGAGVCRDFAHLGITLCRSLRLPARMVVGYLYKLDPMDLHAWYEVFLGGKWFTFDATQPEPRGGRIVVAYGRDAADVAFISDYAAQPLEILKLTVQVQQEQRTSV